MNLIRQCVLALGLGASTMVFGAEFTVGVHGEHATLSAAIAAATAAGTLESHQIMIEAGIYPQSTIMVVPLDATWTVRGGFNSDFTQQFPANSDPGQATQLIGDGADVLEVRMNDGDLILDNFRVLGGESGGYAGGLSLVAQGGAKARISRLQASGNSGIGALGGGVALSTAGLADVTLTDSLIVLNQLTAMHSARGGGLNLVAGGASRIEVTHTDVSGNTVTAPFVAGCGINVFATGQSFIRLANNTISDNRCDSVASDGAGLTIDLIEDAVLYADALAIYGNRVFNNVEAYIHQARITLSHQASVQWRDSLIARSALAGLAISSNNASTSSRVTNLTIADNVSGGVAYLGSGVGNEMFNTIVHNNGGLTQFDLVTVMHSLGSNVPGNPGNPEFRRTHLLDYRLVYGSLGMDQGIDTPNGGLGALDLFGAARIQGAHVDIGALETDPTPPVHIFANGMESTP